MNGKNEEQINLLKFWAEKYENWDYFDGKDPISIPRHYINFADIEISAFLSAWISFGNRKAIMKKGEEMMHLLSPSPSLFIRNRDYNKWQNCNSSFYRFHKYSDLFDICKRLGEIYSQYKTLQDAVINEDVMPVKAIQSLFHGIKGIPSADGNSACKRICLFLRWMIRKNSCVDLGIWDKISPKSLYIPVDVHVYKLAAELGILTRKTIDWKAAEEITAYFRNIFPEDPLKGDFALFGHDMEISSQKKNTKTALVNVFS